MQKQHIIAIILALVLVISAAAIAAQFETYTAFFYAPSGSGEVIYVRAFSEAKAKSKAITRAPVDWDFVYIAQGEWPPMPTQLWALEGGGQGG